MRKKEAWMRNEHITVNFILESCFTTGRNSCDSTFLFSFILYLINDILTQYLTSFDMLPNCFSLVLFVDLVATETWIFADKMKKTT